MFFFGLFFEKFDCGAENFSQNGLLYFFRTAQKNKLFELRKKSTKFFELPQILEKLEARMQ